MKRILPLLFVALFILSVLADFLLYGGVGHSGFLWFQFLGFFALFGFIACVIIVVLSKLLGHYWLQRKENYYDRNDNDK